MYEHKVVLLCKDRLIQMNHMNGLPLGARVSHPPMCARQDSFLLSCFIQTAQGQCRFVAAGGCFARLEVHILLLPP